MAQTRLRDPHLQGECSGFEWQCPWSWRPVVYGSSTGDQCRSGMVKLLRCLTGESLEKACRALRRHRIWKFYLAPSAKAPLNSLDLSLWWWQDSCPMLHVEGLCFSGVRLDCLLNETIVDLFWGVRHLLSVFGHIQLVCSWFPFFVLHRSGAICNVFQLKCSGNNPYLDGKTP